MERSSSLHFMLGQALQELYANAKEDWVEDNRFYFTDLQAANAQVEHANDLLAEMGDQVPEEYKGKQFLVYGHQLKLLPIERIPDAKRLAETFR